MKPITEDTPCTCGHAFGLHSGFHDRGIDGDGSWVDLGCQQCNCNEFEAEDE